VIQPAISRRNRLCPVRIRRTTVSASTDRRSPTPIPASPSPANNPTRGRRRVRLWRPRRRRPRIRGCYHRRCDTRNAVADGWCSHNGPTTTAISDATAKTAIQGYLDALEHRDIDTIARNALCGIYDAVRDRRSDQALAKLSSEAFRKQFTQAQVTSIDKIVYWSDYQAQVLFSMRVETGGGGTSREQVQGIAQLLLQHNQVLVCSYVQRTAGSY
jgi:hypothetical protein